jgi:hypothetical protein
MMDFPGYENLGQLAEWVMLMVSTYAVAAGRKVASELGDEAAKGVAKKITSAAGDAWRWVKGVFAGSPDSECLLTEFEEDPAKMKDMLAVLLANRLKADETGALLDGLRPHAEALRSLAEQLPRPTNIQKAVATGGSTVIQIQNSNNVRM